jgi:hypothetical protein
LPKKKEHKLRVFQNRMLGKIFGSSREEVYTIRNFVILFLSIVLHVEYPVG